MPSIATHYLFGMDLLKCTEDEIKETVFEYPGAFRLGLQGPDIFFYDILLTSISRNRSIGKVMHNRCSDIFFYHFINHLKDMHKAERSACLSYFYGFLCHYSLDSAAHPYVYYYTTIPDIKHSKNISLATHCNMESEIDELLYFEKMKKRISTIRRSDFMSISEEEICYLCNILSSCISDTYHCDISPKFIKGSIHRGLFVNKILNDHLGIKKTLLKAFEKLFIGNSICSSMIFSRNLPSKKCLNRRKQSWNSPVDNTEFNESFDEIYERGLQLALKLTKDARLVLSSDMKISTFIRHTGGFSYHTGKNWRFTAPMQHFYHSR